MTYTAVGSAHSQTLSRGIRVLEILAEARGPLTITELSSALGVHRSIAYRILRTLEDHGLVTRDPAGRISLGSRLAALARSVAHDLQAAALPELTAVANELGMTAFLVVLDLRECITLVSVEPRHAVVTVAQRPGTRHPLAVGAPGLAIQSSLSDSEWEAFAAGEQPRAEAAVAHSSGFATSHDEVIPGMSSVAVPLRIPGHAPAAIAVVFVASDRPVEALAARLTDAAAAVSRDLQ